MKCNYKRSKLIQQHYIHTFPPDDIAVLQKHIALPQVIQNNTSFIVFCPLKIQGLVQIIALIFTQSTSDFIKVFLICNPPVLHTVVSFLCPHIQDQVDCKKVEIPYRNPGLHATQKEQQCGYFRSLLSTILRTPLFKSHLMK